MWEFIVRLSMYGGCRRGGRIGQSIRLLPFAHKHHHHHHNILNQNFDGVHGNDKKHKQGLKTSCRIKVARFDRIFIHSNSRNYALCYIRPVAAAGAQIIF